MDLKHIVEQEVKAYAIKGLNSVSYFLTDPTHNIYSVVTFANVKGQTINNTDLLVEISDDYIIIHQDLNNKPLIDALLQQGIARENIILAYSGEGLTTNSL